MAAVAASIGALRFGPPFLRMARARNQDQAEAARAQADLARAQATQIETERRRTLWGWSPGTVSVYPATLVTDPVEMDTARAQLAAAGPSPYVILRITEGGDSVSRAHHLRESDPGRMRGPRSRCRRPRHHHGGPPLAWGTGHLRRASVLSGYITAPRGQPMQYIRTGALIVGTLGLTLLLSGCPDTDVTQACPGCGAPPTQPAIVPGQSQLPVLPTPSCTNPSDCAGEPTGGPGLGSGGG